MIQLSSIASGIDGNYYRVVESQEVVATMKIVDTLEEQALLEDIIELSKPHLPAQDKKQERHYLLKTPFRYPPLKHGSRFATRFQPSLFYASHTIKSALYESAFYSFYFMSRTETPFQGVINNKKTSFIANVATQHYVDLCLVNEQDAQQSLQHTSDYQYSQQIGSYLRQNGVEAFSYHSAREQGGRHIGVFYINAIKGEPMEQTLWEVKQTQDRMTFYCPSNKSLSIEFAKNEFTQNGVLPHPSS